MQLKLHILGVGVSGIASPFNAQNINRGNRLFGQNTTINTPSIFGTPANTFTPGTGSGQSSIFGTQSPSSFNSNTNTNTEFDNNFAKQVYSFYEKYNPTKIHEIPKLLEKYKGQEQELIRKLEKKYAVENGTSLFVDIINNNNVTGSNEKIAANSNVEKISIFDGIRSPGSVFSPSTISGMFFYILNLGIFCFFIEGKSI